MLNPISTGMGDRFWSVTSHPGQLSVAVLRG